MNISYAVNYPFQDEEWASKLTITAVIAFFAIITTPLVIGLVGWAALLGYLVELIRNVRDGRPNPLPRWDRYADKMTQGGNVLTAGIIYSLPNLLAGCCTFAFTNMMGDGFAGTLSLGLSCCLLPLLLVYNLITWPMLALGMARYAEERNIGVFFQFGDLFENTISRNIGVTLQWALYSLLLNLVLGLVAAIPCIGWAIAPALWLPIQGYLTASYAGIIESPKRVKRKR